MTALLLPFARRLSDDRLVCPQDVPRGLACNCICPGCEHPVLARHGTEREWHFAHAHGEACTEGYEVSVHELAKQLIRQRKALLLPRLEAVVSGTDAYGRVHQERADLFDARTVALDECRSRTRRDEVTADLVGVLKGHEILVEITVFHRLLPEKRQRLMDTGIASLEIDLGAFKTVRATRERVEHAIFVELHNRRWIYHPRRAAAEAGLQARLSERLEDVRREREAEQTRYDVQVERRGVVPAAGRALTLTSVPVVPGWLDADEAEDEDAPAPLPSIWRASFPPAESIAAAQKALAQRAGLPLEGVAAVTGVITTREQLKSCSVAGLAAQWAAALGVSEAEVLRFFSEAGYTLP